MINRNKMDADFIEFYAWTNGRDDSSVVVVARSRNEMKRYQVIIIP